jgi:hypothetical protein
MRRNMPNTSYASLRACHSRRDQRPHGAYSWEADSPHMSTDRCPPSFVAPARSYSRWNPRWRRAKPPRSEDELACAARGDGLGTCWLGVEYTHRSTASAEADRPLSALPEPSSSSGITRLTPAFAQSTRWSASLATGRTAPAGQRSARRGVCEDARRPWVPKAASREHAAHRAGSPWSRI